METGEGGDRGDQWVRAVSVAAAVQRATTNSDGVHLDSFGYGGLDDLRVETHEGSDASLSVTAHVEGDADRERLSGDQ